MNAAETLSPPMAIFVQYFADLGPRWGMSSEMCRLHALLYLLGRPATVDEIGSLLGSDVSDISDALADLSGWNMVRSAEEERWDAAGDPWDLLLAGLEERRRRELPPALEMLRGCHGQAQTDPATPRAVSARISDMLSLAEDLSAIEMQARRLPPRMLRQIIGFGGGAARLFDRALSRPRHRRPE